MIFWIFFAYGFPIILKSNTTATDINTGPLICSRACDQDLALDHSPGQDISLDSQVSLFLTTLTSQIFLYPSPQTVLSLPIFRFPLSLCTLSPHWCLITQCQASWFGHRWPLVEYCTPQPQGMAKFLPFL